MDSSKFSLGDVNDGKGTFSSNHRLFVDDKQY